MGFIETSYGSNPNLSQVNIDSNLNMDTFGISAGGAVSFSGGLDLNNTDLIGVKRFMCSDYLGALLAEASDVLQETVILNNVRNAYTYKFRIPSNFTQGSTVKIGYYFQNATSTVKTTNISKYDKETETYTSVFSQSTADSGWITSDPISVNAGELYCVYCPNYANVRGDMGIKLYYNPIAKAGAVWEVITP